MKRVLTIAVLALVASFFIFKSSMAGNMQAKESGLCNGLLEGITRTPYQTASFTQLYNQALAANCGTVVDYGTLVTLYQSTGGPQWTNRLNWAATKDHCGWYGVSCSAGRVTGLALSQNNLTGALPPELGNLSALQVMDLSKNYLGGVVPSQLGSLASLLSLDLSGNQLTGPVPPAFGKLGKLAELTLAHNQLSGPLPAEVGSLASLVRMDLSRNQISGPIPVEMGSLRALVKLDLSENRFSGAIPAALGNLSALQELNCKKNQLSGPVPTQLGSLAGLTRLNLSENGLSGPLPQQLVNLANLEVMDLSGNQVSGGFPSWMGFLFKLSVLKMEDNLLSGPLPVELGFLNRLQVLDLSGNQLSGWVPGDVRKLTRLTELDLSYNQLTGPAPTELYHLASLEKLNLSHNQFIGIMPAEYGYLTKLTDLDISHNALFGPLPASLVSLTSLNSLFYSHNMDDPDSTEENICTPQDAAFQAWLNGLPVHQGSNQACGIPLILIPGFMDTYLFNDPDEWYCFADNGPAWFPSPLKPWVINNLVLNPDGTPAHDCTKIITNGVNETNLDSLKTYLENNGFSVYYFPYDWRLSLESNADRLERWLSRHTNRKVYLVGHSMGGLLARTFVQNPDRAKKVVKVISIGSPYLGTPHIAYNMRSGSIPDFEFLDLPIIADLIRNSPGSMQLLPSRMYLYRNPHGSYYQHNNVGYFDLDSLNYFFTHHTGRYGTQNNELLQAADAYHQIHDDFSHLGVDYHILAAANNPTRGLIQETDDGCGLFWQYPCVNVIHYVPGDEIVPSTSAASLGIHRENVHITLYTNPGMKIHGELPADPMIKAKTLEILRGQLPPVETFMAGDMQASMAAGVEEPAPQSYLQLAVHGAAQVRVTDSSGRVSGPGEDGAIVNDIPGASYQSTGGQTEVLLPSGEMYTVTLQQAAGLPPTLKVSEMTSESWEAGLWASRAAVFVDLPLTPTGTATLLLDRSAGLDRLSIAIDQNGDGQPDQVMGPSALLDNRQVKDFTSPDVTLQIEGTQDATGVYTGQAAVTIAAEDAGTGVLMIQYSLDGGLTWTEYISPVSFDAGQVTKFTARAVDMAGNVKITSQGFAPQE